MSSGNFLLLKFMKNPWLAVAGIYLNYEIALDFPKEVDAARINEHGGVLLNVTYMYHDLFWW